MKIDCHIKDIYKICVYKTVSQKTKWEASLNAHYVQAFVIKAG